VVKVLYFAALRELAGCEEEALELPAEVHTVRDFVRYLEQARPALAGKMVSVRVALDESFANDSDALHDARVIALIPPVAGG
jgi:molybdopterin converting factor subunit 1